MPGIARHAVLFCVRDVTEALLWSAAVAVAMEHARDTWPRDRWPRGMVGHDLEIWCRWVKSCAAQVASSLDKVTLAKRGM